MDAVHQAPARPVERPRVATIGTLLACGAVAIYFAGLLGVYFAQREAVGKAEWLAGANIPLGPPSMMMATLAISCVSMQWALWAVARNDRLNAYVALGLTTMFGIAVINSQYWMYQQMQLVIAESVQSVLLYAITGSFIALLTSAMVYLAVVTFRTLGGQYGPNQHDAVTGAAIYWYLTVAIFAVLWIAVYITK
jgi:heme/copper-type cytochrome/quinol oxidase subunit 3